ncbi:MAG: hypothetical protein EOP51_12665 [Sphingobacteriales bacterium]|nr:MAG: hypothetical protein EOP51_12665 [Sphingobacteriales bacterium]
MNLAGLIFVLVTHFLAGRGVMAMFGIKENKRKTLALSMIIGVVLFHFLPVVLEVCHIAITATSISIAIGILTLALFLPVSYKLDYSVLKITRPSFTLYEALFATLLILMVIPSVWLCYYFPVFARDVLSGPEPLAEYAVREHTLINSALSVDLTSTNNHLKPPFILGLQVIYKLLVHPFGELWLSIMVCSFLLMFYTLIRERVHALIVLFIMMLFIMMPEIYGYMYIVLSDYPNMVLFFLAFYYLGKYLETKQANTFYFATFLFCLASSIRSETVVLIGLIVPLLLFSFIKDRIKPGVIALRLGILLVIPYLLYYVWMNVFVANYMHIQFNTGEQLSVTSDSVNIFFDRIGIILGPMLFSEHARELFGYIFNIFLFTLALDLVLWRKKIGLQARVMLYGIVVVLVGLPLLGAIIPWFDINNTTKRGVFKLFPLAAFYMANSPTLLQLSQAIKRFEFPELTAQKNAAPVMAQQQKIKKKK